VGVGLHPRRFDCPRVTAPGYGADKALFESVLVAGVPFLDCPLPALAKSPVYLYPLLLGSAGQAQKGYLLLPALSPVLSGDGLVLAPGSLGTVVVLPVIALPDQDSSAPVAGLDLELFNLSLATKGAGLLGCQPHCVSAAARAGLARLPSVSGDATLTALRAAVGWLDRWIEGLAGWADTPGALHIELLGRSLPHRFSPPSIQFLISSPGWRATKKGGTPHAWGRIPSKKAKKRGITPASLRGSCWACAQLGSGCYRLFDLAITLPFGLGLGRALAFGGAFPFGGGQTFLGMSLHLCPCLSLGLSLGQVCATLRAEHFAFRSVIGLSIGELPATIGAKVIGLGLTLSLGDPLTFTLGLGVRKFDPAKVRVDRRVRRYPHLAEVGQLVLFGDLCLIVQVARVGPAYHFQPFGGGLRFASTTV